MIARRALCRALGRVLLCFLAHVPNVRAQLQGPKCVSGVQLINCKDLTTSIIQDYSTENTLYTPIRWLYLGQKNNRGHYFKCGKGETTFANKQAGNDCGASYLYYSPEHGGWVMEGGPVAFPQGGLLGFYTHDIDDPTMPLVKPWTEIAWALSTSADAERTFRNASFVLKRDCQCAECGSNWYGPFTACQLCPYNTTSARNSQIITDCKCPAGYTGPDGGPCTACAPGLYKATIGSAACTDCSASSSCQCAAGSAGITPTPPAPNATKDYVIPNWCTTTAGVPITRPPMFHPYAPGAFIYDRCVPTVVRNSIHFPSAYCEFLLIASFADQNPQIWAAHLPCAQLIVAPGHLRLIVNDSLPMFAANTQTVGKTRPSLFTQGPSFRAFFNSFFKSRKVALIPGQTMCEGTGGVPETCTNLCPSTSDTTNPCHTNWGFTAFNYPMLLADAPWNINIVRRDGTEIVMTWERLPSHRRGFQNPPPTSSYFVEGYVAHLDTTTRFDETTRITKTTAYGTQDFDDRKHVVSGLDPTKTYYLRFAAFTILGDGNYAGPFLVPVGNTEVPFSSSSLCEQCAVGTYQPSSTTFSNQCSACPANTTTSVPGASSLSSCVCMPGFIEQADGTCKFSQCPAGFTNSGLIACKACEAGKYKSGTGSEGCTDCMAGKYLTSTGATAETACVACAAGFTSPIGSDTLEDCVPLACPAGSTGPDGGTCTACVAGKFKTVTGSATCTDCGADTYSTTTGAMAADTCMACPADTQAETGSDAATDCVCVAGYTGPDGGTCTACVAGKYKTDPGSAGCTDCLANSYHALTGRTAASACQCNAGTRVGVACACPLCLPALLCFVLPCPAGNPIGLFQTPGRA